MFIPIVSTVIYLGADKWDAPTTLHEILNTKNGSILKQIPNYFINLFSPADFRDEGFQKNRIKCRVEVIPLNYILGGNRYEEILLGIL